MLTQSSSYYLFAAFVRVLVAIKLSVLLYDNHSCFLSLCRGSGNVTLAYVNPACQNSREG